MKNERLSRYLVCVGNENPGQYQPLNVVARSRDMAIFEAGKRAAALELKDNYRNPWKVLSVERKEKSRATE